MTFGQCFSFSSHIGLWAMKISTNHPQSPPTHLQNYSTHSNAGGRVEHLNCELFCLTIRPRLLTSSNLKTDDKNWYFLKISAFLTILEILINLAELIDVFCWDLNCLCNSFSSMTHGHGILKVCSRFVFSCFDEIKTFFLDFPLSVLLTVVPKSGQSVYFLFSISTFRLFVQSQLLHPAK